MIPPGRTRSANRRSASVGSFMNIRTSRPTAASNSCPESADRGVYLAERDVGDSLRYAPLLGQNDGVAVEVYHGNRTLGTDEGAQQEADVAGPAANVEYVHASTDPGPAQHPFGQRPEYLGLLDQPFILGAAAAKSIVGVLHCPRSPNGRHLITGSPASRLTSLSRARPATGTPSCSTSQILLVSVSRCGSPSGSPSTISRSASLPSSTVPMCSARPSASAAVLVAAVSASRGLSPWRIIRWISSPVPKATSLPSAILTPASRAARMLVAPSPMLRRASSASIGVISGKGSASSPSTSPSPAIQ